MDVQIVWAFPFFFALLGIEMLSSRILGRRDHLLEDMVTDISCGIGEQLTGALARGLVFAGYVLLYHQVAPFHFEKEQISAWIIGMVGVDLGAVQPVIDDFMQDPRSLQGLAGSFVAMGTKLNAKGLSGVLSQLAQGAVGE